VSAGRALLIAAPASGAGKTTLVAGLLRALAQRGVRVRPAKSGPDYIDPAFHAAAAGRAGPNLDAWAMPQSLRAALIARALEDSDLLLVEGAMGLFDGVAGGARHAGSAALLAAEHEIPVLLVVDVWHQFQTAAAVVRGLATHDARVHVAGVVLNRAAGERHAQGVAAAVRELGLPVLGWLPRDAALERPSRHLGLVQASEHADLDAWLDGLAARVRERIDLDALVALARAPEPCAALAAPALAAPGKRIALAADAAFTFVYPHVLDAWQEQGAEVVRFSPLADEPPPAQCDACWLPGGYPELHAAQLARATRFLEGLRAFAATRPVHGECGGYMVLGRMLEDGQGVRHALAGLLGHSTSFARPRLHLGYREARWRGEPAFGRADRALRGHEFHHSSLLEPGSDEPCVELFDGTGAPLGPAGGRRGRVTGTFFHAIAAQ
jgi:cobyrinic acid a,c-diamide synthase